MKRINLITIFLYLSTSIVSAQTSPPADLAAIQQNFKKLNTLGSVLYIAAHPDDENTRLLAYLAQEKHYRTGYLSCTRGDGGQNLIGNEQSELLGLIRTQELLAARRVDGAEQFFTRANDFGFSKGPEETLKIWDKDKVLGDMVWVIRKFRPDVMICRFPTTGEGGHGHHTSSAILAQEAFAAAADPKRYPEQLKYVQPWQAKRLLWNTFSFGSVNTTASDQFKINVGVYNPILGKGYGELAAESRSNHKTQGFGSAKQRGEFYEYFKTILGDAPQNDLMDGVNTTWKRVKDGEAIGAGIGIVNRDFNPEAPEKSVPALVQLLSKVEKISDIYWRTQKTKELSELIAACSGLWFEAYATEPTYALGDQIQVRAQVVDRYSNRVKINSIAFQNNVSNLNSQVIPANQQQTFEQSGTADKLTQPYWLETPHSLGAYNLADETLAGNPENPDLPKVDFEFIIEGKPVRFERRLLYKYVDPVRGEVYQPLEITPPVTANIENQDYIFNSQQEQQVQIKLKSFTAASGNISLKPIEGWKIDPKKIEFTGKNKNDEWTVTFSIAPTDNKPRVNNLQAVVTVNGKTFSLALRRIRYDHVPAITLFPPAETRLVNLDLKIAGKKLAYITGAGDLMPEALRQVGYDVHLLSENEIMNADLSVYDAIITGVRAYNVNERLRYEQSRLMDYVKNGGNLLVQYNNNAGLVIKQIGPYPFRVVNERVTDENAEVTILDKQNPVLNYPNKITQDDFKGWIQERGLYFVSDIDSQYKTVLQMNDKGEQPNNGSLIVGDYGKGRFVYTSLAFFRELPAGVPGAYRLFINLLSKPKGQSL
ncbi:PIG-L family deacetylase [Mucilaginibacter sp. SG564]|uniref:PIG-L family deacetylase n=1 Tax=unclassified Mucilaginibacter TaxID=2617802 RepID=UPI00155604A7|nr:PIG-L family deacetylase [Mucilaginibacter sp. SG564]NOW98329.1 LmbE family N-acetylglucosaminyl deacetylase [Mucilaginibacter sp. SG564]